MSGPALSVIAYEIRIVELLAKLTEHVSRSTASPPESVTWGDVADLSRICDALAELVPCDECKGSGADGGQDCSRCGGSGHV